MILEFSNTRLSVCDLRIVFAQLSDFLVSEKYIKCSHSPFLNLVQRMPVIRTSLGIA